MNAEGKRDPNRLKQKLSEGKVCLGATITMNSPIVAEILSHVGLDWVWFETEHTALNMQNALTMMQATNGSKTSSVMRVPWNDKTMIKRALDIGPDGIIVPLVNSAEEAEAAVKAMKYPPLGERGAGLNRAQCYGLHMGDYMATANDEVMTILGIEHIDAVNSIDDILNVNGVDSVMIGSLDLSGSMGKLGQTNDPEVEGAVMKILKACKKYNKPAGIVTTSPEQTNMRISQGFTNIIIGIDVLFLHGIVNQYLGQIKLPA